LTDEEKTTEFEGILLRLEQSRSDLVQAIEAVDPSRFDGEDDESPARRLERTVDDVNFYYGLLAARALNLPQPPFLPRADFGTPLEGVAALDVAHRRLTTLLHDVTESDLERRAEGPDQGTYTLRQILEMAIGHYAMRRGQIRSQADPVRIDSAE
jgi:hypothetical protein